ncbi:ATP phosphoribosyltransferase [Klebsiella pneumoniae]|nr:ATP phosphoribosyltransferase [Klebsiella pneumoniae]
MLEDVWIFQWCMNAREPRKIHFRGLFFGPNSDRFRQVFRGKEQC